jgi:hypothetical protein
LYGLRRFGFARRLAACQALDNLRVDPAFPTNGKIVGACFATSGANPFVGRAAGIGGDRYGRRCCLTLNLRGRFLNPLGRGRIVN